MLNMPPLPRKPTTRKKAEIDATILIVDDNPDNRLLLASQLSMHGYSILEAADGPEGIKVTQEKKPDLILLDVMMPMMNGFEVCSHLKSNPETASIPVIIITALREIEYRIQGIEVGADEFLSRPHNREELLVRVRSLIRLKHARDQLEQERNQLRLLYEVSRATLNTQLDIDQMMSEIISHTQTAVGATKGSIMIVNAAGEVTHKILIRAGLMPKMSENVTQAVMEQGLAGWLIKNRRSDIIEDITQDDRWVTLPDDTEQVGSVVGVPLIKGELLVGILILIHPQPRYFQPKHVTLLETIAAQVTVAVHNAYLFNEINEQRKKLGTFLARSTDAILTTDEERCLTLLNHAAEEKFQLNAAEVVHTNVEQINHLSPLLPLFDKAIEEGNPITEEINVINERILFASVTPIPAVGYMAVMQDVTEMKRMEVLRLEQERREKELVKSAFARYMSPRLVEQVLSDEPTLLGRRQRRRAVVMFADLRGFTRMIVGLEPNSSIAILNEFFTEMTNLVYEFDGTIFDLAGDELMVGFNVPIDQIDAGYRAMMTAVAMQQKFNGLRQRWYRHTGVDLGLGVGIDEGDVVLGNVGAETRMNFAMVGEAVNTAHRLVDIAQDGQVVVSAGVYQAVVDKDPDLLVRASVDSMGEVPLKGKLVPQLLYRANIPRTPLEG